MARLNNRYFAMRHGQSLANEQGIIISHPANGVLAEYGLSEIGKNQVAASVKKSILPPDTVIYSSDFSRARQTAEIVCQQIGGSEVTLAEELRERYFGDWEKMPFANYEKVWQVDREHADWHKHNVEPVNDVLTRTLRLITEIEYHHLERDILLVSHGDTLQILQVGLSGQSPTKHRDLPYFETAEIRRLV
jgi:probable phosphoglycerate mutase